MNGPAHYREADLLIVEMDCEYGCPHSGCVHEMRLIARAQVHATLALAASTVAMYIRAMTPADRHEWTKAIDPEYAAEQAAEVTR